jgi:hypothetical protein
VNWAAGRGDSGEAITAEAIEANLTRAVDRIRTVLVHLARMCCDG